jgi:hypothetical protein
MRAVFRRVETELLDPALENARVVTSGEVRRVVDAARKQEVLGRQPRLLDPLLRRVSSDLGDLELNRSLGLVLHHQGSRRYSIAVANVPDLQAHQVATAQLAVDSQVEQCELPHTALHLQPDAQSSDVLDFERSLLADDLDFVLRLAMFQIDVGFHDGLPSS